MITISKITLTKEKHHTYTLFYKGEDFSVKKQTKLKGKGFLKVSFLWWKERLSRFRVKLTEESGMRLSIEKYFVLLHRQIERLLNTYQYMFNLSKNEK